MIFAEEVFGGSVPKNFFPAVEKGVRLAAEKGVLAGYPVVGLKATLLDGELPPRGQLRNGLYHGCKAGL